MERWSGSWDRLGIKKTGTRESCHSCVAPYPFGVFQKEEPAPLRAFLTKFLYTRLQIKLVKLATIGSLVLSIVTGHRLLLKGVVLDHKKRDVDGTATCVVDQDVWLSVIFFVQSIGDRCLGQLVDEPQHIHTVDVPSILGCLALQIVEIYWYGHNCIVHGHGIGCVLVMLVRHQRRDKGCARGILLLRYIAHSVLGAKIHANMQNKHVSWCQERIRRLC